MFPSAGIVNFARGDRPNKYKFKYVSKWANVLFVTD